MAEESIAQLSVHRTFVVQLYIPSHPGEELWRGRVEHVASGQSMRFASLTELTAFVEQLLYAPPDPN